VLVAGCIAVSAGLACRYSTGSATPRSAVPSPTPAAVQFVEISDAAGIHFRHETGATGRKYMPDTMGSGVAFFDYDNDGWQDLLFVNCTGWPGGKPRHDTLHLYRNSRNGTFTDVTDDVGLN